MLLFDTAMMAQQCMGSYFLDATKVFDRIDYSLFIRSGENPLILVYGSTGQCALEWISFS